MRIKVIKTSDPLGSGMICYCDHLEDIIEKLIKQEEIEEFIVYKPSPDAYPTPGCSSDYVVEIYDDYRE